MNPKASQDCSALEIETRKTSPTTPMENKDVLLANLLIKKQNKNVSSIEIENPSMCSTCQIQDTGAAGFILPV